MHIIDVARRRRNIMEEVVTSAFPYLTPPNQESLVKTVLDLLPPDLRDAGLLDLAESGTFFEEFQARQRTLLEDIRKKSAAEEETASKKAAANAARSKSKAEFWAKKVS